MAARNGGYRSGETGYRKLSGRGEMVTMPNHPNKPEMGSRQGRLAVRFGSIAPISAKKLTSVQTSGAG